MAEPSGHGGHSGPLSYLIMFVGEQSDPLSFWVGMEATLDTSAILLSIEEDAMNISATWATLWTPQLPDCIKVHGGYLSRHIS